MRKTTIKFILFISLIFAFQVNAQTEYPIKNVNGIDYFVYTVQQSEGLYAISRRFDVTQSEINTLNPEIHTGLQVGQKILIPISDLMKEKLSTAEKTPEKTEVEQVKRQDYVLHEVLRRQTLFAISRIYEVEQDEIIRLNPDIENKRLKTGMILRIPVKGTTTEIEKKNDNAASSSTVSQQSTSTQKLDSQFIIHTVKAGETFYSLSNLYKVSIDEIISLNNITDGKLRSGAEIKIPNNKKIIKDTAEEIVGAALKQTTDSTKTTDIANANTYIELNEGLKPNKKPLQIAFLLPFMLDATKKTASIERFEDFYAGALLAIEQAKAKGISLEILTLDTENTDEKIISVLENENLKKMDLIIGPAYSNQIPHISNYARSNKIHTLIPFSSNVNDVQTNKYLFQFNPDIDVQANFLKNILLNEYRDQEIVFIQLEGVNSSDSGNELTVALRDLLNIQKRKYKIVKLNKNNQVELNAAINQNKKNIVFFNTDKYSTVSPYFSMLESANANNTILLFEQNGWIQRNIEHISTFSISPFKTIENNKEFKKYNSNFKKYFDWDVSKQQPHFDILGYDLTSYFISMLYTYDAQFKVDPFTHLLPQSVGIQSNLMFFKRSAESGFKNHTLYLNEKHSTK